MTIGSTESSFWKTTMEERGKVRNYLIKSNFPGYEEKEIELTKDIEIITHFDQEPQTNCYVRGPIGYLDLILSIYIHHFVEEVKEDYNATKPDYLRLEDDDTYFFQIYEMNGEFFHSMKIKNGLWGYTRFYNKPMYDNLIIYK